MDIGVDSVAGWQQALEELVGRDLPRPLVLRCIGLFGQQVPEHVWATFENAAAPTWRVVALAGAALGEATCTADSEAFLMNMAESWRPEGDATFSGWLRRLTDVAVVSLLPTTNNLSVWSMTANEAPMRTAWRIEMVSGEVIDLPRSGNSDVQQRAAEGLAVAVRDALQA